MPSSFFARVELDNRSLDEFLQSIVKEAASAGLAKKPTEKTPSGEPNYARIRAKGFNGQEFSLKIPSGGVSMMLRWADAPGICTAYGGPDPARVVVSVAFGNNFGLAQKGYEVICAAVQGKAYSISDLLDTSPLSPVAGSGAGYIRR